VAERVRVPAIAWAGWILGSVYFAYAFFQRVAPSVMVDGLMRDFAVGGAILGNLSAFYFYAYAGLQLPVGLLVDRWGPRRVLTVTAAFCGLGTVLFATADGLAAAYAGRFMIGAGAAFGFVGALTLATSWFPPRRFAALAGLTMLAGMAGGMLGQAPLAAVVEWAGWRGALYGAAGFGFLLAALVWLVVRDRPDRADGEAEHAGATLSAFAGLRDVASNPQTWMLAVCGGLLSAPLLAFGGLWGVPYVMERYGASRPGAALAITFILIGWAVGSPVSGWLSDHLGRRRAPMAAGALIAMLSLLAALYLPGLPLVAFSGLLFVSGGAAAAMVICYATARELNPGRAVGTAYGFVNMMTVGSGALFQPLIGWLLDLNWDGAMHEGARVYDAEAYAAAFAVLPGCLAAAFVVSFFVRETWCRPIEAAA